MKQHSIRSSRIVMFIISICLANGRSQAVFGQTGTPPSSAIVVQHVMRTALSRCYSTVNGVKRITFESPTPEEFAEMEALGPSAIAPLAKYLDLEPKNGLTQLFAVKFLVAIGDLSTLDPLKRAFAQDQWEITRAAALSGMFAVSRLIAKPYVDAALQDKSQLVHRRGLQLLALYQQQEKPPVQETVHQF